MISIIILIVKWWNEQRRWGWCHSIAIARSARKQHKVVSSAADMICPADHIRNAKTAVIRAGRYWATTLMADFADFIMYAMPGQGCDESDTCRTTAFLLFVLSILWFYGCINGMFSGSLRLLTGGTRCDFCAFFVTGFVVVLPLFHVTVQFRVCERIFGVHAATPWAMLAGDSPVCAWAGGQNESPSCEVLSPGVCAGVEWGTTDGGAGSLPFTPDASIADQAGLSDTGANSQTLPHCDGSHSFLWTPADDVADTPSGVAAYPGTLAGRDGCGQFRKKERYFVTEWRRLQLNCFPEYLF